MLYTIVIRFTRKKLQAVYESISQQTGLQLKKAGLIGNPMLHGSYRNHAVVVNTTYEGSGKNRKSYFTINIDTKESKIPPFTLTEENFFTKLGKKIGFKEATLGNPHFDERFYISGNKDEALLRSKINSTVQQMISNLSSGFKMEFSTMGITHKIRKNPDANTVVKTIQDLIRVVEEIEKR